MKLEEINRNQVLTLLAIVLLLFGLLGLPLVLQHLYGISAIKTAFAVIVVYAVINWYMKSRNRKITSN
jgi:hypothetical protein